MEQICPKLKKQIISIFLLFMLIAPAVVTYSWLQQRKRAVKKEVKWKMIAGIDKSELVLLKFSKAETSTKLKWKHSKETKLNKQLDELLVGVYQYDSKSKEKQDLLYKFYKSIYFQPVFSWLPFIDKSRPTKVNMYGGFYQTKFLIVDSPPPNIYS